jgi:phosphate transport system permease protein
MSKPASETDSGATAVTPRRTIDAVNASLARRYAKERRFRRIGIAAVVLGVSFVAILFTSIVG